MKRSLNQIKNTGKKLFRKMIGTSVAAILALSFSSAGFVYAAEGDSQPNDPYLGNSWQLEQIGINNTWNAINTDNEIVVAVLDTGLDINTQDLQGRITNGYDYILNTADMTDTDGHGTMVASAVAAVANNGIGIAGAAGTANVKIAPYRVGEGSLDNDSVYNAIIDASNREDVRIINLSFGSNVYNEQQAQAIAYAVSKGKIIIAGAGNHGEEKDGLDPYYYPASYPGVISVGSVGKNGNIASFSQTNDAVDLYVPGESLTLISLNNRYVWESGTSFSSGIVSGIAASLLAQNPNLTADDVQSILKETAKSLGDSELAFGAGEIQADQALNLVKSRMSFTYIAAQESLALSQSL
ncbi:S8 family serine peptidase [Eubacteriaceae bacterium ES2]|nr:S8 family serine peptidase [Eubacteriaceae bacterium ES2]